jgi:hypothetical protein
MAKWADYLISAVRFNQERTHINLVRVHEDRDTSTGPAQDISRQEVIKHLKQATTFCTVFKGSDGNWKKGQLVEIVTIDGVEFIKTLADRIKADNLDNLPEF